jgi:hypothetical protein
VQKALGRRRHSAKIVLHENSELNTLKEKGDPSGSRRGTEEVEVETVDAFCESNDIESIDLLKMDVQGWEMEVIHGAENMIEENKVQFILSEVAFRRADEDMQHFSELNDYLEGAGFWLCGFYDPFRWGARKQFVGFVDALYMRREAEAA